MFDVPEDIKKLFRSDNTKENTRKKFRLYFFTNNSKTPWLLIENDRIVSESLQITESLSSSEDLTFGSCEGSEMQITVADVIEDVTGKEFTLTVEVGGYEMALGIYTVKSFERQSDRRKRKITAYDRMSWFNVDVAGWYNELSFPMTLKTFRDSLCEYIGIQQIDTNLLFDSLQISKTIEPKQISGLDVLKAICEINGCFGRITKEGKINYLTLSKAGLYPSETLYPALDLYPSELGGEAGVENITTYKQPLIYEDSLVEEITWLTIKDQDGNVIASAGEGSNEYIISGNFLVYGREANEMITIVNSLLLAIKGYVYRPAEVDCNYLPWLEIGDAIRIITQRDVIETYIFKRVESGCQNMRDKIQSTGSKNKEYNSSFHEKIINSEGKMITIQKTIDNVSVVLEDFEKDTLAKLEVTAESIAAEVTRATESEAKLSASIKVNSDNIKLKVSAGDVSSEISQESGGINISGNRFTWKSTNSSMESDGTLTCQNIKATSGTFTGTIDGSNISGSTITGTNIKGTTITGSEITSPKITGGTIENIDLKSVNLKSTDSFEANRIEPGAISCNEVTSANADFNIVMWKYYFGKKSDRRLKEHIKNIDSDAAMDMILNSNPVSYYQKKAKKEQIGFIAQDIKPFADRNNFSDFCYFKDSNGYYSIPYENYIGLMTCCLKNIKERIEKLNESHHIRI